MYSAFVIAPADSSPESTGHTPDSGIRDGDNSDIFSSPEIGRNSPENYNNTNYSAGIQRGDCFANSPEIANTFFINDLYAKNINRGEAEISSPEITLNSPESDDAGELVDPSFSSPNSDAISPKDNAGICDLAGKHGVIVNACSLKTGIPVAIDTAIERNMAMNTGRVSSPESVKNSPEIEHEYVPCL